MWLRPPAADRQEAFHTPTRPNNRGNGLEPLASMMVASSPLFTVRSNSFEGKRVPDKTADLTIAEKSWAWQKFSECQCPR